MFGENSSTDGYDELGISLDYDSKDGVIVLVFYEPEKVVFKGIDLFKLSVSEAYKIMASLVKDIAIDGLTSFKFGIGFYEPNYEEEPFLPVEAIIIFIEGYYD